MRNSGEKEAKRSGRSMVDVDAALPDVVKDIVVFVVRVAAAFLWLLVMLLIISFVTLGVLHFELKYMVLASAVFALIVAVLAGRPLAAKYGKRG